MPRITSRKKMYMEKDIGSWVRGEMARKKIRQKHMADCMGITQQAFGQKVIKNQFTYADLLTIFQELQTEDEDIIRLMKV